MAINDNSRLLSKRAAKTWNLRAAVDLSHVRIVFLSEESSLR